MKNICFQMNRKAWLVAIMVLCLSFPALAQKITVSGTVTDKTGEPLIGASVLAKGTQQGTATDFDGNYRIDVDANATLVFSYVGYDTQNVAVNGRTTIDVVLSENSVMLNEVVAIGYGTVKKSDATGAVSAIKPSEVQAGLSTSAQDLLVGRSPGVVVTTAGGQPEGKANIQIRGGASLSASNEPLIVIDGVPMDTKGTLGSSNPLSLVNPESIESMTILKDASATAIFGSRASNGVIIITTKKGSSGAPTVNFAANMYINTPRNYMDMMSASQFRNFIINMAKAHRRPTPSATLLPIGRRRCSAPPSAPTTTSASEAHTVLFPSACRSAIPTTTVSWRPPRWTVPLSASTFRPSSSTDSFLSTPTSAAHTSTTASTRSRLLVVP